MKINKNIFSQIKNIVLFIFTAFLINSIFVFSLPLIEFLNSNDLNSLLASKKETIEAVRVNLNKPPKKVRKIKPRLEQRKTELSRKVNSSANRFQLALGVNQGTGVALGVGEAGQKNIIFSQNEVEVDPIRTGGKTPIIPAEFSDLKQKGKVDVEVVIDEKGNVIEASALTENPPGYGLKESALSAIKTWKFKPAMVNRIPVKVRVIIPFIY